MADLELDVPNSTQHPDTNTTLSFNINPWIILIVLASIAILWYFFGSKLYRSVFPKRPEPLDEVDAVDEDDDDAYDADDELLLPPGIEINSLLQLLTAQHQHQNQNPQKQTDASKIQELDEDADDGYTDDDESQNDDHDQTHDVSQHAEQPKAEQQPSQPKEDTPKPPVQKSTKKRSAKSKPDDA